MEFMSEAEFQGWIRNHKGERGREPYYETAPVETVDEYGDPVTKNQRTLVGTKITARDGATIIVKRTQESGQPGKPDYQVAARMDPDPDAGRTPRTPEQTRADEAAAVAQEQKNSQAQREANEIDYNSRTPDEFGEAVPETHAERAARVQKKRLDIQQQQVQQQTIAASQAQAEATRARISQDKDELASREREGAAGRALTARQIELQQARDDREAKKPTFLSDANDKNQFITRYNPDTGAIENVANPNYDAVKVAAEEKRKDIALQIQAGSLNLEGAKQAYTQWFDTNVKTPLMLAQEERARAEERRQALDAEERRKQFAATFGLQKATLGQKAGQDAAQNEISLLPYRSGPTWGADFSDAINGLAAGGKVDGPSAAAGIHFSDSSFAFDRPDFKKIAAEATKAAIGHLTDYKPSSEQYAVGDYSNVPAVNLSGMPTYQFQPVSLPAPSPGSSQPSQ